MRSPIRPRDLGAAEALLSAAILFVALFAWGASTDMFSREGLASTDNWAWRLWQVGALLMGIPGVWWIWRNTRNIPSAWALILTAFAVVVFVNMYGDHSSDFSASPFGENTQTVWECVKALVVGFSLAGALALWQRGGTAYRVGSVLAIAFGAVDLVNANFLQNGTIWQILDPLMILAALYWAVDEVRPGASPAGDA